MPLPPILEIFVIWHPDDPVGEEVFERLQTHFHSDAFSGLAGGAVDVYPRSQSWGAPGSPPRPVGHRGAPDETLLPAEFVAIVPVIGIGMRRSADADEEWSRYLASLVEARGANLLVLPIAAKGVNLAEYRVGEIFREVQRLPIDEDSEPGALERSVAQAVAQHVAASDVPLAVFVSHAKHHSEAEADNVSPFELVRQVLSQMHLNEFFDATAIQPGSTWERELEREASRSALLIVRTDRYATREWTVREVLAAKRHDMPIVSLIALTEGEQRGSFVLDHVPTVPWRADEPERGIRVALSRLVDEALKRALWRAQTSYLEGAGFDWTPVHAPEPLTAMPWLAAHVPEQLLDGHLVIVHPDPPLTPPELEVTAELGALAGFEDRVDVLTPRTFAARGGKFHQGSDSELVPRDALVGTRVAVSVSESSDLAELGLTAAHLDQAVAEIARAVVIAGGSIVYGGRINTGFTKIVEHEAQRFSRGDKVSFEHALPASELTSYAAFEAYVRAIPRRSRVIVIDADGGRRDAVEIRRDQFDRYTDQEGALSQMRDYVASSCDARVLIGGRLSGFIGELPGIVDEAARSGERQIPIYIAGGFGGAATMAGRYLLPESYGWLPSSVPSATPEIVQASERALSGVPEPHAVNGLNPYEQAQLAASYRPSDIASLAVVGLSRVRAGKGGDG